MKIKSERLKIKDQAEVEEKEYGILDIYALYELIDSFDDDWVWHTVSAASAQGDQRYLRVSDRQIYGK